MPAHADIQRTRIDCLLADFARRRPVLPQGAKDAPSTGPPLNLSDRLLDLLVMALIDQATASAAL